MAEPLPLRLSGPTLGFPAPLGPSDPVRAAEPTGAGTGTAHADGPDPRSELHTLYALTDRLARTDSLDQALSAVLEDGASLIGARRGMLVINAEGAAGATVGFGLDHADLGALETVPSGQVLAPTGGVPTGDRFREVARQLGIGASYALPLAAPGAAGGSAAGAAGVETEAVAPFGAVVWFYDAAPAEAAGPADPVAAEDVPQPYAGIGTANTGSPGGTGSTPGGPLASVPPPAPHAGLDDGQDHPSATGLTGPQPSPAATETGVHPVLPGPAQPYPGPYAQPGAQPPQLPPGYLQPQPGQARLTAQQPGRLLPAAAPAAPAGPGERERRLAQLYTTAAARYIAKELDRDRLRRAAAALRRGLLPDRLPRVPGMQLAARCHSTNPDHGAGSDWYDALALPDNGLALSVGSVTGGGPDAAAAMGRLRAALRAYAVLEGEDPVAVLGDLELLLKNTEPARSATALYAYVEPRTRQLSLAGAGQCPPLLVTSYGASFVETSLSAPLGMLSCWEAPGVELRADRGDLLLLYTEGMARRCGDSLHTGQTRLRAAAADAPREARTDPDRFCDYLLDVCLPEPRADGRAARDDVVLLAARFD